MDLSKKIELLIQEKETRANEESKRVLDIFRRHYKAFEKLIKSHIANKGKEEFKDGAYLTISKFLASEGIVRKDGKPLTVHQISQNIKQVRKEKGVVKITNEKNGKLKSFEYVIEDEKDWEAVAERLDGTMSSWDVEDKKDYYELEKIKRKGIEFTSYQNHCYDKLIRKKENSQAMK